MMATCPSGPYTRYYSLRHAILDRDWLVEHMGVGLEREYVCCQLVPTHKMWQVYSSKPSFTTEWIPMQDHGYNISNISNKNNFVLAIYLQTHSLTWPKQYKLQIRLALPKKEKRQWLMKHVVLKKHNYPLIHEKLPLHMIQTSSQHSDPIRFI